jgi:hypothetical protein
MRRQRIMGPVILITIGTLFAIDHIWGWWRFGQTWPVILIVIGAVKLFERMTYDPNAEAQRPWYPQTPPPPVYNMPPQTPPPPPSVPGTLNTGHPDDWHSGSGPSSNPGGN